ncbi:nSTAND1 domain-containing NTPase [Nocardia inohanensis]|uniref:nSTAND1 domain-containing NTPase n=1 Tax=Nocardia inohanensis TaxID=209246 RepID=UPI000A7549F5|nr:NACHT and WD repeat domain-containing protein [Nocardia inohanensis]
MLAGERKNAGPDGEDEVRILSPRALFAQRFGELYAAAGNPTLRRVAAAADQRMRAAQGNRAGAASAQRISDWKAGRNVPARFESLLPVVLTLVELARKNEAPLSRELADPQRWQRLWQSATTWDPEGEAESACPYPGLAPYGRADRALFFGRDRAVGELVELVGAARGIVVVVGASGAGKSSLLAAGVGAAKTGRHVVTFTPGAQPRARLAAALGEDDGGADRLVIVDQFEELFTVCTDDTERQSFLTELHECSCRADDPIAVLVALRADFYAQCLNYPTLRDALEHRSYPLGPLSPDELAQAISSPARAIGMELEAGLEELIVSELRSAGDHHDDRAYDPGALPLLSHVMAATWQHREGRRLTVDGYRKAGGVAGAVAETAERTWSELSPAQQAAAKEILLGLVAVGQDSRDTRRHADRAELLRRAAEPEDVTAALEVLARARLITLDADAVTLTHEIVLSAWPRLRGWIDEDRVGYLIRQRLESDAAEWAGQDRDSSLLYRGTRLQSARAATDRSPVGPLATEFLATSVTTSVGARRRTTRMKALFALLGVVLLLMGFGLYTQDPQADQRRADRDYAAVLAAADQVQQTNPTLAAQLNLVAWRLRPGDQAVRSRLLQTEADPLFTVSTGAHQQNVGKVVRQPGGSMLASLAGTELRFWEFGRPLRAIGEAQANIDDVAMAPGGRLMATADLRGPAEHTVTLWDIALPGPPRRLGTLPGPTDAGTARIAFAPDGRTVAALTDTRLVLWNVSDPRTPVVTAIRELNEAQRDASQGRIVFSPNGRTLALALGSGDAATGNTQLWDVTDPAHPAIVTAALAVSGPTKAIAFSPDGATLAVGSGYSSIDGEGKRAAIQLWDTAQPRQAQLLSTFETGDNSIAAMEFAPAGDALASTGNRTAGLWNVLDPGSPRRSIDKLPTALSDCHFGTVSARCTGGPKALAFASDGRQLVTGGLSGELYVWSLPAAVLTGHIGWRYPPAFAANGARMATSTADGRIELWDIRDPRSPTRIGEYRTARGSFGATLSPDGSQLRILDLTARTLRTLDISDPAHIGLRGEWTLPASESLAGLSVSRDFRRLATSDDKGGVQLWDLSDTTRPGPWAPDSPPPTRQAR